MCNSPRSTVVALLTHELVAWQKKNARSAFLGSVLYLFLTYLINATLDTDSEPSTLEACKLN